MNEITYLIIQAEKFLEEKEYELCASYNLDTWISLKEYMMQNDMKSLNDIYFKTKEDTKIVKDWFKNFIVDAVNEAQFKTNIEIISGIISYMELSDKELIEKNRELADSYFNIGEYETCENLYKIYIEKNPKVLEYYYGYALTLINRQEFIKAINILEEGIDNSFKDDYFLNPAFEVLIDTYENINEFENANKTREKQNTFKKLS